MAANATTDDLLFEEEQSFRQPWTWALLVGVFVFVTGSFAWGVISDPAKVAGGVWKMPAVLFLLIWGGVALLFFSLRLTVRVDRRYLHIRYFPFVTKDIPLEEIEQWEARTYRPILEYGGWGIRRGRCGWAYNVNGNQGVQLTLTNGKRILIGSQKSADFAAAIGQGKQ